VEALRADTQLGTYPAIRVLLQLATLPVTTATGEWKLQRSQVLENIIFDQR